MTGRDDEALDALEGFDEREMLTVFAGCAALDAFRMWGATLIEALRGLVIALTLPLT